MATATLINTSDIATCVLDTIAPYRILDFDEGLCLMTGYSQQELTEKICTLDKLAYVDDYTEVVSSVNYQLSISNLVNIQSRLTTRDGEIITVICHGQALALADGREVLQCFFTDITNLENAASETAQAKTDLEIFANTVPSGVSKHILDNHLSLVWANNYFYNMCGYTEESYKKKFHKNTLSIIYREDLAIVIDALADLTDTFDSKILNYRISCSDGSIKWVNAVFAKAGETKDGFPVVNLVMSDVTDLKIAEMKANLEEQKYLIIADISDELAYEYDMIDDVLTFAEKFNHIFEGENIIAHPRAYLNNNFTLISHDTRDAVIELFDMVRSGTEYYTTEFKLNTKNRGFQWYLSTFSTIYDENGSPIRVVGLLRNIHAQKTEQQKLITRAETDLMTGLLNKATTESKITKSLRNIDGNSYDVLMLIDIDDFKKINDSYGHLTGDEVIIKIADTLKKYTPEEYNLAGRIGGDEFLVFLTNVLDTQIAQEKAQLIADELRQAYPGGNNSPKVTLSIGIASTNEQIPYSILLENADKAVYQAKLKGKDCYFCYTENMERSVYVNNRNVPAADSYNNPAFFSEFLSILFDNANVYAAIENAIAMIGKKFDVDKICIWEYTYNKNFVENTHQWVAEGITNNKELLQHTPSSVLEEINSMSSDGIVYSSDTSLIKLNNSVSVIQNEGMKSFIQSAIYYNNTPVGYISFAIMDEEKSWSTATLSQFRILFKLLSEAVCAKITLKNVAYLREDTINIFSQVTTPIIIANRDTYEVLYFNNAAKFYYPKLDINELCYDCVCNNERPCADCQLHKLSNHRNVKTTTTNPNDGVSVDINISPIKWTTHENSFIMSITPHEQTESERLESEVEMNVSFEKRVEEASYKDFTTGYNNFERFKLDIKEILDNNLEEDYVMFYFNVRNFKYINETYGTLIGDKTLKTIADTLAKNCAESEAFARIISDTYIMLVKAEGFMDKLTKIKDEVRTNCKLIQDKFLIDFLTGILIIDESIHNLNVNKLVDRAMMACKSISLGSGVSHAFYNDQYHKAILDEAQLENSMYLALANGEFSPYVQPKYDIVTNTLVGGELLVRWLSPSKGFLEPSAFIPTFERNGFIYQIDCFMLEEACKSIRRYLDSDVYVLPFSVNLSKVTLNNPNFLDRVSELINKYHVPYQYIEFEITESIFTENREQMISTLNTLKERGFILNMDDFGTGYSALTLLRELPLDVIKLDQDFLSRSVANDEKCVNILKGIIDMAHALNIRVVSEGIEDEEQLNMLRRINCEIGQGYHFAKPMPIDDYDKIVIEFTGNAE